MNIYDISKKAGVSIATISRVLNNSKKVSPETRAKVLRVMEENGYTPNAFARGLGLNSMKTIGILCADASDIFFATAISVLQSSLRVYQYNTLLCSTGYELEDKKKDLELLLQNRVDAIIVIGSNYIEPDNSNNQYLINAAKSVPVMIINGILEANNIYCCSCNDLEIMEEITKKFNKNSQRIIYLYHSNSYSSRKKLEGFLKAKTSKPSDAIFSKEMDDVETILKKVYKENPFDCILCSDDEIAIYACSFINKKGLKIPQDIQVVGYNNSRYSYYATPKLTSVDNHVEELCKQTVNHLMSIFDEKKPEQISTVLATLVKRETTL